MEEGRRLKVELNNKDEEMQHLKKAFDALDKEKHVCVGVCVHLSLFISVCVCLC